MLASVRCQKPVAKWQREHQLLSSSECSRCYYFTVQGRWNERGSRSIGASLHWSYITKKKCTQFNEVARVNSFLLRPKYAFLKEIVSDKNKPTEILSLFPVRGHFQVIVIFGELSSPFWGLKGAGYMAGCTIAWVFVSLQTLYVEILMPDVVVLVGGLRDILSHEGGTITNRTNASSKRLQKDPWPIPPVKTLRNLWPGRGPLPSYAGSLILDPQPPNLGENFCCLQASQSVVFHFSSLQRLRWLFCESESILKELISQRIWYFSFPDLIWFLTFNYFQSYLILISPYFFLI